MSECYQFFRQPMDHPFGAAIEFGWNSLRQWSNLRDAHLTISCLRSWINSPLSWYPLSWWWHRHAERGNVPRSAKFPGAKVTSWIPNRSARSEEHTSELQSLAYLVCRLL